jgi:putative ABC transport system permease protein
MILADSIKELMKEVYASVVRHRVRSLLTGFGVSWGIFILIVLLGAGNGFRAGTVAMFKDFAANSVWVTGNRVSKATRGGLQTGTQVRFNDAVTGKLDARFDEILEITSEMRMPSSGGVVYGSNSGKFDVKGVKENYLLIKSLEIEKGRFLNGRDYGERRRVAVIGSRTENVLFENVEPVGKYIGIDGVMFLVVGVLKEGTIFGRLEENSIYVPDETLFYVFNVDREYSSFGVLIDGDTDAVAFERQLRGSLASEAGFDPKDGSAVYVTNIQLQVKAFNSLFDGINVFLWILGLCFLLSGMTGIMNIMLVTVKERTSEIGIRKAIGATPASVVALVIAESLVITVGFGIAGMAAGFGGMEVYNFLVSAAQTGEQEVFAEATVDVPVAVSALVILVVSGVLAGVFPAWKAAGIMPVETLNKIV